MKQMFVIEHNCKTKFGISTEFLVEAIYDYSVHQIKATATEITETEPETRDCQLCENKLIGICHKCKWYKIGTQDLFTAAGR